MVSLLLSSASALRYRTAFVRCQTTTLANTPKKSFPRNRVQNYNARRFFYRSIRSGSRRKRMPHPPRPRFLCLPAILLALACTSVALAQHDPGGVTGGGMVGGSTGRSKPATTKPATKPAPQQSPPETKNHSASSLNARQQQRPQPAQRRLLLPTRRSSLQRAEISRSTRTLFKGHEDQSVDDLRPLSHRLDLQRSRRVRLRTRSNPASYRRSAKLRRGTFRVGLCLSQSSKNSPKLSPHSRKLFDSNLTTQPRTTRSDGSTTNRKITPKRSRV